MDTANNNEKNINIIITIRGRTEQIASTWIKANMEH